MRKHVLYILTIPLLFAFSCTNDLSEELEANWNYDSPLSLGVSGAHLLLLDQEIKKGNLGKVNNLLILKDDKVIFENYYNGFMPDSLNHLGRASQSIFTLFIGKVIEETNIPADTLIFNYFSDYSSYFENIPQKDKITFQHLIDHESGFWWEDWNMFEDPADGDAVKMKNSPDWVEQVLSTRMIREPGMQYNYNSGHSILLSEIISKQLGEDLGAYFEANFFSPMHIYNWQWSTTPKGRLNTVNGLSLRTSDMAKIGQLILKEGVSEDGDRLIPDHWTGYLKTVLSQNTSYWAGPSWYRFAPQNDVIPNQFVNDVLFCWGEGGKFIMVVPHQSMVIVLNAECKTIAEERAIFKYVGDYIFTSTISSSQP